MKQYQFIGLITLVLAFGCKTNQQISQQETRQNTVSNQQVNASNLSEEKSIEFEYLYIEGLKQKMLGNSDAAIQYFNNCLEIDPTSAASLYELANIYVGKGELISAALLLEKAIQINPENKWYQLLLAQIHQNNNQYEKASEIYSRLIEKYPDNIDYYYMNALLLTSAENYDAAIKAYNELEQAGGYNEQIALSRQHLYRQAGKNKEAYNEIEKLIGRYPGVPEYYGVMADMYKEDGNMDKALEYYNKVIEIDPSNSFVHFSLASFYLQKKETQKGFEHASIAFSNPEIEIETKIQLYLMMVGAPEKMKLDSTQMEALIGMLLKAHPDDARSYSIKADYLIQQGREAEARDFMVKALEINPDTYPLWEQLILTENRMLDFENMALHTERAMLLFPTQPLLYVLNAVAQIQLKNYDKALSVLENGQIYVADNKRLEAQFELYRAEAYYNMEQSEEAFQAFEKVIEMEPENFMAMNNYAYYLSLHGEQLEKAEVLSGRVVQANPNNPTYLDTHAWVLFQKKEYRLAKFYMDTAMKNGGDESEVIVEHYGDILFMLNDVEEAIKYWQKSLDMGNESELLKKKISEKRYIEEER
jgi:tetratricopeptide (TPR) repeat protein